MNSPVKGCEQLGARTWTAQWRAVNSPVQGHEQPSKGQWTVRCKGMNSPVKGHAQLGARTWTAQWRGMCVLFPCCVGSISERLVFQISVLPSNLMDWPRNLKHNCFSSKYCVKFTDGLWLEKPCLWCFANNKGTDQPVHLHSLISAFGIRLLESILSRLAMSKITIF